VWRRRPGTRQPFIPTDDVQQLFEVLFDIRRELVSIRELLEDQDESTEDLEEDDS
jgi:hypothetical protein